MTTTTNKISTRQLAATASARLFVHSDGTSNNTHVIVEGAEGQLFRLDNVVRIRWDISKKKQVLILELINVELELAALLAANGIRIRQRSTRGASR